MTLELFAWLICAFFLVVFTVKAALYSIIVVAVSNGSKFGLSLIGIGWIIMFFFWYLLIVWFP